MRIVKIDKSKFSANKGNSVYRLEHAPDEYIICAYIDDGTSQDLIIPSLYRALTPNGYRATTEISTGSVIVSIVAVVDKYTAVEII